MESEDQASNPSDDIIGSATASKNVDFCETAQQIIQSLAARGCPDYTSSIDTTSCSDFPFAGGGVCDVYRGRLKSGLKVAIKSLRVYDMGEADTEGQKILKHTAKELYHWSKLKHRNVLPLIGLAFYRGYLSMLSAWMENGNLNTYIRLNPKTNRTMICMDICEGLCHIHSSGMVHGDLKAANVLVSTEGVAMITDFGNAQLKDLTLKFTNTANCMISVRWAAPELLLDETCPQVSKEADVYAYGMEVLAGKVPYDGHNDNRVILLVAILKKSPERPLDRICDDLWNIMNSCWIHDPSARYTMQSIRHRLRILFPSPSESVGGGPPEIPNKAVSRHASEGSEATIKGRALVPTLPKQAQPVVTTGLPIQREGFNVGHLIGSQKQDRPQLFPEQNLAPTVPPKDFSLAAPANLTHNSSPAQSSDPPPTRTPSHRLPHYKIRPTAPEQEFQPTTTPIERLMSTSGICKN